MAYHGYASRPNRFCTILSIGLPQRGSKNDPATACFRLPKRVNLRRIAPIALGARIAGLMSCSIRASSMAVSLYSRVARRLTIACISSTEHSHLSLKSQARFGGLQVLTAPSNVMLLSACIFEAPTRQIAENSTVDGGVVVDRMRNGKGNYGFGASHCEYLVS